MKVLMKKVGGGKKARMWNMAQFQPRRWHREQEQLAKTEAPAIQIPQTAPALPQTSPIPITSVVPSENRLGPVGVSTVPTGSPPLGSVHAPAQDHSSFAALQQLAVTQSSRARVGKIARLPHDARETVNSMLRGGFRYNDIAAHLEQLGYHGITSNNISFWKHHGYMDWLARQHELEARAHLVKSFEHCTRALDTDRVQQNALAFAAEQLCQVMALYDHRNILNVLNARPELFPKFVESMAVLSRCSNDLARAFAANRGTDGAIRAEMKSNPITASLSEPISEADLDHEENMPAPAAVRGSDSSARSSAETSDCGVQSARDAQHWSMANHTHNGGPRQNLTAPLASRPPANGVSPSNSEPSLGNSKQIQASTTIPAGNSDPTTSAERPPAPSQLTPTHKESQAEAKVGIGRP